MIADRLSIHPSTVSRILNSIGRDVDKWASPETVDRVRTLARELNYHPNPYAASLRTARSSFVGVIVPRLQDFVLATIYEGIEEAATENNLSTFVTNSLDVPENQRLRAQTMLKRRVEGLIFGDAHLDEPFLDELAAHNMPFVLVNRYAGDHVAATCDDYYGGRLVATHLLSVGRRDVAVLAGQRFASTGQDRTRGVIDVFREAGLDIPEHRIVYGDFDAPGGRKATERLLASGRPPDAIFATNDFAAIGALGVLRDHGLHVPTDVALVGFNDTLLAAELSVPLTTVRSPMHQMGRRALEMLLCVMRGEAVKSEKLKPELIARESTRRGAA
ncbi:LacI family DNA-binding transcriptional regulator [Sphaerisporangium perillae]|uniref:LacI family DNA-binding transcriptional regulator n=1 Tax=Sphaerisporangium perillae TaxID=2935860 RepID=UPI00200C6498|nr:LacI family DNA-binding transcriptional regulator [Sphaerisporangium perillae]